MEKEKKGFFARIITEYKKVTWADVPTVFQVTIIVLLITAFIAIMVMSFDVIFKYFLNGLSNVIKYLIGLL